MKKLFDGVCTALVTPFKDNGKNIDWKSFGRLINFQIENGVNALLVLGTTGESCTISDAERAAIVTFAVSVIDKRVPLIIGVGGNDPKKVIENTLFAKDSGVDAVLVSAPYYNKTTQDGLVKYFDTIARATKFPIIAYNVPGRVGMNIEPQTFARICRNKHIVGIKESSGNLEQIQRVVQLCSNVAVYCGDDSMSLGSYAVGTVGVVSVASNIMPLEVGDIYKLYRAGKMWRARRLFFSQLDFYKDLFVQVNPIPVKYYLSEKGLCRNEVRLPLLAMEV